jgi:large repetitive protein
MQRFSRLVLGVGLVISGGLFAVGCTDDDKKKSGGAPISGPVVAGVVANADVSVYLVNSDRTLTRISQGMTDATGGFNLSPTGAGPFLVVAGGGSFTDEATNSFRTLSAIPDPLATLDSPRPGTLEAMIGENPGTGSIALSLTPLSSIAARRAVEASKTDPAALQETAIQTAAEELAVEFGLGTAGSPVDLRSIVPLDFTNVADAGAIATDPNSAAAAMGAILAGLSQQAEDLGLTNPLDLVDALAADFADGSFNGQDASGTTIPLNGGTLDPAAGTSGIADATQDFLNSPENTTTTDSTDFTSLTDDLATQDVAPVGVNLTPSFSPIPDASGVATFAETVTINNVTAGSGETQVLTFSVTSSATGVVPTPTISGSGTTRTLSFTGASAGTSTITVTVTDDGGTASGAVDNSSVSFVVTIIATVPPSITSTSTPSVNVPGTYSYTAAASGTPAPTLSVTSGLPTWATFNTTTNVLSGTPTGADQGTSAAITITATNTVGADATQVFTIDVNAAPTVTSVAVPTTGADTILYTHTFISDGFPAATYSITGLPLTTSNWLAFTPGTGVLTGTPGTIDVGTTGTITLTATNSVGSVSEPFTISVSSTPTPPTITSTPPAGTIVVPTPYSYDVNATGTPAPTYTATPLPASGWLTINAATGVLSGTPAGSDSQVVPTITVTASNGVGAPSTQTVDITVNASPAFTSGAVPAAQRNVAYAGHTFTASGFPAPTFSITSGTLPTGMTFVAGALAGTPTDPGASVPLTITATNAGGTANSVINLAVNEPPTVTSAGAPAGEIGVVYAGHTFVATGFPVPTWSLTTGTLPTGLTLAGAALSGTPTGAGSGGVSGTLTFTATNGVGADDTSVFTITINEAPTITSGTVPDGQNGVAYAGHTFTATGFPAPTFTETAGTLPTGLGFAAPTISGTPTVTGNSGSMTYTASNGIGSDATTTFSFDINEAPSVTSGPAPAGEIGVAYAGHTFTATGSPAPTFSLTSGTLPAGLTFAGSTITGTPTGSGGVSGTLTFTATNGIGADDTSVFTITVNEAPTFTSGAVPAGQRSVVYGGHTFTASGFPAPTFSVTSGTLPTGMTLAAGGALAGTPTDAGASVALTITAGNTIGTDADSVISLVINEPPTITSATPPADVLAGSAYTHTFTATGFPAPTFALASAPTGIGVNPTTGATTGSAGVASLGGNAGIVLTASNGIGADDTETFAINVEGATVTSTNAVGAVQNAPFTFTVTGTAEPGPVVIAHTLGTLPTGVTFTTPTFSGTPTQSGTFVLTVTASTNGNTTSGGSVVTDTQTLTLTVGAAATGVWDTGTWDGSLWGN